MRYFALILFYFFLHSFLDAQTLIPQFESIKSYGGNNDDGGGGGFHFSQDRNILYASGSNSTTHDLSCNVPLSAKAWLLKVDKQGNEIFSTCFGGSLREDSVTGSYEFFNDMVATKDSGCIAACYTNSANIPPQSMFPYACMDSAHGQKMLSLVKFDKYGNVQWSQCYGGGNDDGIFSVDNTSDGGYIFLASVRSTGGQVGFHYGNIFASDAWLVKTDSAGNIQWKEVLGGTGDENPRKVKEISPGRYMTAITTNSTDGNLTNVVHYSNDDAWICVFDSVGDIIKQGVVPWYGAVVDITDFVITKDGALMCVGDAKGNGTINYTNCTATSDGDFAVFKMDTAFQIQWCNIQYASIGYLTSIASFSDTTFIVCGVSSGTSYNSSCTIDSAANTWGWVISVDINGNILWKKMLCTSNGSALEYCLVDTETNSIYLSGGANTMDGDLAGVTNYGGYDELILKVGLVTGIEPIGENNPVAIFPNPADDIFNIQVSGGSINYPYALSDIAGRNILSGVLNTGTTQVNIGSLTTGLYLLKIGELNPQEFKIVKE